MQIEAGPGAKDPVRFGLPARMVKSTMGRSFLTRLPVEFEN
jgi:hypothetical protein